MSLVAIRRLRHVPDRFWHARRRRQALTCVGTLAVPATVLVVCHGNICRSPFAAAALQARLPPQLRADMHITSAGFIGEGRPCPAPAVATARLYGIDLTRHRSTLLTPGAVRSASLVLVAEPGQRRVLRELFGRAEATTLLLGDFDPEPILSRAVVDPFGESIDVFTQCYTRVWRCVSALASALPGVDEPGFAPPRTPPAR